MRPGRFRFTIRGIMLAVAIGTIVSVAAARSWDRSRRLHALAVARHDAALEFYKGTEALFPSEITFTDLYFASRKLMEAESDLWSPAIAARNHLGRWKKLEQTMDRAKAEHPGACWSLVNLEEFEMYVKEAEYWAARDQ
jgi:hypothetical protein